VARVKAGAVVKPTEEEDKSQEAAARPKRKGPAEKRECSICGTPKSVARSFKLTGACAHFSEICSLCIQKMLKDKIASRKLDEPELACPFPKCEHNMDATALKQICTKAFFVDYDKALVKHHLAASPNFIACLSLKCGHYFSIEECQATTKRSTKSKAKQNIACCYCDYEICLTCVRPWHSNTSCDKVKEKENEQSLAQIKKMGAKPCPKCGVNIEKNGGCDHMHRNTCRHDFCWQCLVPYHGNVQHLEHCSHSRRNVTVDPGNWAPDNLNQAQINRLIADAERRLD
ncbi:hypothetical protein EK21DRAFT_22220, partial [Setomelanomma holmii]